MVQLVMNAGCGLLAESVRCILLAASDSFGLMCSVCCISIAAGQFAAAGSSGQNCFSR